MGGMAAGGIAAFAEGGEVEEADEEERDQAEYAALIQAYMDEANSAGLEGIRVNRTKDVEKGVVRKADGGIVGLNKGGAIRFKDTGLVEGLYAGEAPSAEFDPRYEDTEPFDIGAALDQARLDRDTASKNLRGINPQTNRFKFDADKSKLNQLTERARNLQNMYSDDMANSPEARPATLADVYKARPKMLPGNAIPLPNVPYAPRESAPVMLPTVTVNSGKNAPAEESLPVTSQMDMYPEEQGGLAFLGSQTPLGRGAPPASNVAQKTGQGAPVGAGGSGTAPRGAVESGATADRPRSSFDEFMQDLKTSRSDLAKQKEEDKYMALLSAGLGMMSGTSPNAFANVGQGAQAGLATYAASGKQRAAEKAALDKNMLLGQRYQSMEGIANRTADVNEARYQSAAAARAAGGTGKEDDLTRRQIADIGRLAESRFRTLSANASKANQYLDPAGYAKAQEALSNDPELNRYNTIIKQLTNKMYGLSDEAPAPSAPANRPALSSFQR
jgi:hypothetical protein